MEQIKKIDIHAHVEPFPQYAPKYRGTNLTKVGPSELIGIYDKLGIEKGVLLPLVSPEAATNTSSNESIKYVVDQSPERFLWFCNVDPRALDNSKDSNLGYLLEHYMSLGAKGVGNGKTLF